MSTTLQAINVAWQPIYELFILIIFTQDNGFWELDKMFKIYQSTD